MSIQQETVPIYFIARRPAQFYIYRFLATDLRLRFHKLAEEKMKAATYVSNPQEVRDANIPDHCEASSNSPRVAQVCDSKRSRDEDQEWAGSSFQ